ncbi:unnamed protein product [Effrenium voratum]|nr:unnamed protein product [Effrenium voratum]
MPHQSPIIDRRVWMPAGPRQLLETVREHRTLHEAEDAKEITPRSYQRIKAKCVQVTAEIDAKLSQLKRRTPKSPQPTQKSAPRLRKAASGSSLGTVQERLRRKISECRSWSETNLKGRSVALELERECGKGPLKPEAREQSNRARVTPVGDALPPRAGRRLGCLQRCQALARFCAQREKPRPVREDFVARNRATSQQQGRAQAARQLQSLRRCARTDAARKLRQQTLGQLQQVAQENYWQRFFASPEPSTEAATTEQAAEEVSIVEASPLDTINLEDALEDLSRHIPSKKWKLFSKIFHRDQLRSLFQGNILENVMASCRLVTLMNRLVHWSRVWRKHQAATKLVHFMRIPPPLGFRIKLPMHRYFDRLLALQRQWRHFEWRLEKITAYVYETFWLPQEKETLHDIFLCCPGDKATMVARPELLCLDEDSEVPWPRRRPSSAKEKGHFETKELKKLLLAAFNRRKRQHQFKPAVAHSIIRREVLERLYTYSSRLPAEMRRTFHRQNSMKFGMPSSVALTENVVDELICSAHQACGVRPVLQKHCDEVLPCARWRVAAARSLLQGKRTIRQGLQDHRAAAEGRRNSAAKVAAGEEEEASSHTAGDSAVSESDQELPDASSRQQGRRLAVADEVQAHDPLQGGGGVLSMHLSRRRRRRSEGLSEVSVVSSHALRPRDIEDVLDTNFHFQALNHQEEDLPSERPSLHLPTKEAGWPSLSLSKLPWPNLEAVLQDD